MKSETKITIAIILCIFSVLFVTKMAFAEEVQTITSDYNVAFEDDTEPQGELIDYVVEEGTFTVECDEECAAEYWVLNNLVKDVWNEEHDEEFYDYFWDYVKFQTSLRLLSTKYNVEQFKK